ncbi:hypothetical protein ACFE04_026346 [Oxalis oulophora]
MNEYDNEGVKNNNTYREWEHVSLTASAYPSEVQLKNDDDEYYTRDYFVFPPSEHENLPIEPDINRIQRENADTQHFNIVYQGFAGVQPLDSKGKSAAFQEKIHMPEYNAELAIRSLDTSEPDEKHRYDDADVPCGAWWKRSAVYVYAQAKETNSYWSICIAATVLGLVILERRWHSTTSSTETMGRMLSPISRLKDVIVGHRQGYFINHASPSQS